MRETSAHRRRRVVELGGRDVDVTLDDVGVVHLEQHRRDALAGHRPRKG